MARLTLVLDCLDPPALVGFWREALGYIDIPWPDDRYMILAEDGGPGPVFVLQRVPEAKAGKNRMHLDIHTESLEEEVARLEALGATRAPMQQQDEDQISWVVMHDPEGNEFCVVSP